MSTPLTLDEVVAIDIHTHVYGSACDGEHSIDPSMEKFYEYFGAEAVVPTVDTVAEYYRDRKIMAVTSNPMHLDDVAVDFPSLTIIGSHPAFPWQDEAISVALHKPNFYIDLSGWSPKYFSENLIRYSNSLLRTKVLFGSDYPMITPDKWMADFELVGFKDEVRPLIFKENAMRVLGLTPSINDTTDTPEEHTS